MTNIDIKTIIPFFHQYGIKKAAVFGSVARNEETKNSDLDLVVSFGKQYDLLDMVGLKQDIEDALHIPVDIITYESLRNDSFAKAVLEEGKIIYEQM
ncbi:hypothetical protein CE91St36_19910 [Christensenellaceae bacterium]|uniref:nucleotidyltransferase family protein n=1 Tax=Christensenella timonensis TaxID=1816678 RepID=UPI00082C26ED|nr:nucleotidyltransferase domain-containing protein [Christensenella timonensis]BDF59174.1 hypothetical protein CE91St36_19910 [Christensenellaceae bacterium]BDF61840.1 hypothetical protein CE91St37_19900 [Christensenellaceae bacterium]